MKYAQLGKTDLQVSRICIGCWQLSPAFWGDVPLKPWEKALKAGLDLGVNFVDTANSYGDGHAESALGAFLKRENLRDRFVVATKFFWNLEAQPRHPDTSHAYILRECEKSLRALQTDRIDLYQIHSWDALTRPEEVAAALHQLKREGKVRWFGVSNLNVEQMRMYQRFFAIDSYQPHYNLIMRDNEATEFPYCLGERIGVVAYSPLFHGLLAGKYDRQARFDDVRGRKAFFKGAAFHRLLDALDQARPVAERHGLSMAQLAVRWILTHPATTAAIVGVKRDEHVTGIAAAADQPLPAGDWHLLARLFERARVEAEQLT